MMKNISKCTNAKGKTNQFQHNLSFFCFEDMKTKQTFSFFLQTKRKISFPREPWKYHSNEIFLLTILRKHVCKYI